MALEEEDTTNLKAQDQEGPVLTPSAPRDTGRVLTARTLMDSTRVDGDLSPGDQQHNFILPKIHHMHTVPDRAAHGGGGPGLLWDSSSPKQTHEQKTKSLLQTWVAISRLEVERSLLT